MRTPVGIHPPGVRCTYAFRSTDPEQPAARRGVLVVVRDLVVRRVHRVDVRGGERLADAGAGALPVQARAAAVALPVLREFALQRIVPITVRIARLGQHAIAVGRPVVVEGLVLRLVVRLLEALLEVLVGGRVGVVGEVGAAPGIADGRLGLVPVQAGLAAGLLPLAAQLAFGLLEAAAAVLLARL